MKEKNLVLIKEISEWCFVNNSKSFTCFFGFSAHVENFDVKLHSGGWGENCEELLDLSFIPTNGSIKCLYDTLKYMAAFKEKHDQFFSNESIEERKAKKKALRIKKLERELERLNN